MNRNLGRVDVTAVLIYMALGYMLIRMFVWFVGIDL